MDERSRRLWAGAEAGAIGYGGVVAVARATGLAISTVRKGRDEVRAGARPDDVVNVRRSTGTRSYEAANPEVWPALEKLVDPLTRGDPESPLRWTCKSTPVFAVTSIEAWWLPTPVWKSDTPSAPRTPVPRKRRKKRTRRTAREHGDAGPLILARAGDPRMVSPSRHRGHEGQSVALGVGAG